MLKLALHFFVILALVGCGANKDMSSQSDVVLVMGDSLSAGYGLDDPEEEGWVWQMERAMRTDGFLGTQQRVVNASVSGETTQGGLDRLPDLLEEHQPDVVLIELGANDALRRQSLAQMKRNLSSMVDLSQKAGAKVVLVGMELPMIANVLGSGGLGDAIEEVANTHNIPVVAFPMSDLMGDDLMQEDRLHPTKDGQPIIQKTIEPVLRATMQAN